MRLVDLDDAVKALEQACPNDGQMSCRDAVAVIGTVPTIEPRRKGKWHYTDAYPHWMCCDQCFKKFLPNREWVELYNIPTNYCPFCGADMRGEK